MTKYSFRELVIDARTGLNPRKNFTLGNGNNYYITIKDIHDGKIIISDKTDRIDDAAIAMIKKRSRIKNGDILFTSIGRIGETAIVTDKNDTWDVNESVFVFTLDTKIITQEYFCALMLSEGVQERLQKDSSGSTFKSIKMNQLERMTFNVPPINIQQEITEKLSHIRELILDRQEQLVLFDDLIKSRFIEMFGDPVSNPFRWSTLTMKQASIRLSDGPFGSNLKSEHYTDEGVRVIRLGNIGCGYFNDEDQSYISPEHYATIKKYTCRAGEIVIATLGDPNLRACIVPDHIEYGVNKSDCVHYIPKAEILNNQFVCQYINCPETLSLASGMVHGQTRSRISSGQLADLPIYLPPMDLQQQFAAFVEQTDKSKYHGETTCEMEVAA